MTSDSPRPVQRPPGSANENTFDRDVTLLSVRGLTVWVYASETTSTTSTQFASNPLSQTVVSETNPATDSIVG